MRILLSTSCLTVFLFGLPAQSQSEISLEIDVSPPGVGHPNPETEEGEWITAESTQTEDHLIGDFRIMVRGTEGSWFHPVFDVNVVAPGEFEDHEWLYAGISKAASLMEWYHTGIPVGDNDPDIFRVHTGQRMIDFAVAGGTGSPSADAVRDWCQPLLTQGPINAPGLNDSHRIWTIDSPLWTGNTIGGIVHRPLWAALLRDQDDTPTRSFTALSASAALRHAVVQQSAYVEGSLLPATILLNSDTYTDAVREGWIELSIQAFAARAPYDTGEDPFMQFDELVRVIGDEPPFQSPPPTSGVSVAGRHPVAFGHQAGDGVHLLADRVFEAGTVVQFIHNEGTHPVKVRFRSTVSSYVEAFARATPTYGLSGLYTFFVPTTAASGAVSISTGLNPQFDEVGDVVIIQPQQF